MLQLLLYDCFKLWLFASIYRSFSRLKLIKKLFGLDYVTDLTIISIEQDISKKIEFKDIISDFWQYFSIFLLWFMFLMIFKYLVLSVLKFIISCLILLVSICIYTANQRAFSSMFVTLLL